MFFKLNTNKNVWEENPGLDKVGAFADLKKKEGKRRSSTIVLAIALAFHPKSPVYQTFSSEKERMEEVGRTFTTREHVVDFSKYTGLIEAFKNTCISKPLQFLMEWEKSLREYDEYSKEMTFKDNYKNKVESLKGRKDLWDVFLQAEEEYLDEESRVGAAIVGGYHESVGTESLSLFD